MPQSLKTNKIYNQKGFTLIEMLLSITILAFLAGISLPFYQGFQNRNELATTTQSIGEMLRRSQAYAKASQFDSQWGVNFSNTEVTLFRGANYATKVSGFEEIITLPFGTTLTFTGDIVFAKQSGIPASTLNQTVNAAGHSQNIIMNSKGMVDD